VLPTNVWLTSLTGTVAPGVTFGSGGAAGGSTNQIRSQLQVPAIELVGCTTSQAEVSRVMTRLRLMDEVTRVSLASSEKVEGAAAAQRPAGGRASGGAGGDADCRHGNAKFPRFELVVFFKAMPGAAAGGQPGAPGAQPGAPQTPPPAGNNSNGSQSASNDSPAQSNRQGAQRPATPGGAG
jgi:hypothetical protein